MARIRPNPKVVQSAGEKLGMAKGALNWLEQERQNKIREEQMRREDAKWEREKDFTAEQNRLNRDIQLKQLEEQRRASKAKLSFEQGEKNFKNYYDQVSDPFLSIPERHLIVQTAPVSSHHRIALGRAFRASISKDMDTRVKHIANMKRVPEYQVGEGVNNVFDWVTPEVYKSPTLKTALRTYIGLPSNATFSEARRYFKNWQIGANRKGKAVDASKRHDLKNTSGIHPDFESVRIRSQEFLRNALKGDPEKDTGITTVGSVRNLMDGLFSHLSGQISGNKEFISRYQTDPDFRKSINANIQDKVNTITSNFKSKTASNYKVNLAERLKTHLPELFKGVAPQERETFKVPLNENDLRVNESDSVTGPEPINKTGIKIRKMSKFNYGKDDFGLVDNKAPEYLPYIYADLTHKYSNSDDKPEHYDTAVKITTALDNFVNGRGWEKLAGPDAISPQDEVLDIMSQELGDKISENELRHAFMLGVKLRLDESIETDYKGGDSFRIKNPNLRAPEPKGDQERAKDRRQYNVWEDLRLDLQQMKLLATRIDGVTGASAELEQAIVTGIVRVKTIGDSVARFLGADSKTSEAYKALEGLWDEQDEDYLESRGINVTNKIRIQKAKLKSKDRLNFIDQREQSELAKAKDDAERTVIRSRYRAQKLFEFKKIALTYRLSSMLQGDGLGGGRTISNMDFEVALKALWGEQSSLHLRLDEFLATVTHKQAALKDELKYDGKPLYNVIKGSHRAFNDWDSRRRTNKIIMQAQNGGDVRQYDGQINNLVYHANQIINTPEKSSTDFTKDINSNIARSINRHGDTVKNYTSFAELLNSKRTDVATSKPVYPQKERSLLQDLESISGRIVEGHIAMLMSIQAGGQPYTGTITESHRKQYFPDYWKARNTINRVLFDRIKGEVD